MTWLLKSIQISHRYTKTKVFTNFIIWIGSALDSLGYLEDAIKMYDRAI